MQSSNLDSQLHLWHQSQLEEPRGLSPEQAPQGSAHGTKPVRVQAASGRCS